jgi:hypothetical protein
LFLFKTGAFWFFQKKSLGQLLRDANKQFQFATENCQCENKTKRSLLSEPPIFAIGMFACSSALFARIIHFGCAIKERQSNKLYKIIAFVAMFHKALGARLNVD